MKCLLSVKIQTVMSSAAGAKTNHGHEQPDINMCVCVGGV